MILLDCILEYKDLITTVTSILATLSLVFGVFQLRLARKNYVDFYEMERRKEAIKVIKDWSDFVAHSGTAARGIAETLDSINSKRLWQEKPLQINVTYKSYLEDHFSNIGEISLLENSSYIELTSHQTKIIRQKLASYLNKLEVIMSARYHNVADKEMIDEQFSNLLISKDGSEILQNIRNIAGGKEVFPSIEASIQELKQETSSNPKKTKLGKL